MASCINKVLQVCDRHLFAKPVLSNQILHHFKYGPGGELLKNNIYQEWFYTNVIKAEGSIFPYNAGKIFTGNITKDLKEPYEHVKHLTNGILPFGIAVNHSEVGIKEPEKQDKENIDEYLKEIYYFKPHRHTILQLYMFIQPAGATKFFYQWQQQRKMWWRKFSASPGRFSLADINIGDTGQIVDIQVTFPWGVETVETISHRGSLPFDTLEKTERELFEAKDGRRKVVPHVVESTIILEGAVFTFLCDAYDEVMFLGLPREVMRFHRKLAPYKASFSASSPNASAGEELGLLALYLTKQLRNAGISTLLLPDVVKSSLESQFARNDELGIPYTVVLNDSTLKTGIIGLRSRDTTLKEQVHITDLRSYMEQLMKNY